MDSTAPFPAKSAATESAFARFREGLLEQQVAVEHWFRQRFRDTPAPFYGSVDLRQAFFKLAPVDTNLFPAGFNNIGPEFRPLAVQAVQSAVERLCPHARGILVVPEAHTRNLNYWESVATLTEILEFAGLNAHVGMAAATETATAHTITLPSGRSVDVEPVQRKGDRLMVGEFTPCAILLNNDLSSGLPDLLDGIAQPVLPPAALGWWKRRKSHHFSLYRDVAREFAKLVGVDPWFLDPAFRRCGRVDFMQREGEECLAAHIAAVLAEMRDKYQEYGIRERPFAVVKADAGTYGMAVMMVTSPEDVVGLNRKQRTRMSHTKDGQSVAEVLVQEGIPSFETVAPPPGYPLGHQTVAEPVVYTIDHFVVGGFYRAHPDRGTSDNLNSPGMSFEPIPFAAPCHYPDTEGGNHEPGRFYSYGVVARLALLAAAREIAEVTAESPNPGNLSP